LDSTIGLIPIFFIGCGSAVNVPDLEENHRKLLNIPRIKTRCIGEGTRERIAGSTHQMANLLEDRSITAKRAGMKRGTTRRYMIQLSGIVAAILVAGRFNRVAQANENQVSKDVAKYRAHPNGIQRCEICLQFNPPNRCKIVAGEISPKGWCQYFAARENAD
jgi:hypothetical protein